MSTASAGGKPKASPAKGDADVAPSPGLGKNIVVAYVLWLTLGVFGAHHAYLGRYSQGMLWLQTFGLFGVGWVRDALMIPRYVREANADSATDRLFDARKRIRQGVPELNFERIVAEFVVGCMYWYIGRYAMHSAPEDASGDTEVPCSVLSHTLGAAGAAFGVWMVGNLGNEAGRFRETAAGAALAAAVCASGGSASPVYVVLSAIGAFNRTRSLQRSRDHSFAGKRRGVARQLCACCVVQCLFIVIVLVALSASPSVDIRTADAGDSGASSSHEYSGEKQERAQGTFSKWWESFQSTGGFSRRYNDFLNSLQTEPDPYEVLGISRSATTSEIKAAYHEQVLKWHPDKNPDNLTEATKRFMLIQEAYEKLAKKHNMRTRRNQRNRANPEEDEEASTRPSQRSRKRRPEGGAEEQQQSSSTGSKQRKQRHRKSSSTKKTRSSRKARGA